jgi:hypothetical protein
MSKSPNALGFFSPTGCVAPPEFAWYHAYWDSRASSSPNEYRVAVLARAAYSRSASVSSLYVFPTFFESQAANAFASCQLMQTTGCRSSWLEKERHERSD